MTAIAIETPDAMMVAAVDAILPPSAGVVPELRQHAGELLHTRCAAPELVDDALPILSELLANAVHYGPGVIRLRMRYSLHRRTAREGGGRQPLLGQIVFGTVRRRVRARPGPCRRAHTGVGGNGGGITTWCVLATGDRGGLTA